MNILQRAVQVRVVGALIEGCSIRSTERMTGVHRDTIMRLGVRLGEACQRIHDRRVREVIPTMIQLDEAWAYVQKKQGHKAEDDPEEWGDQYVFVATDTITKLTLAYLTGKRTADSTRTFATDLRGRVLGRPHLVSDGFNAYPDAIEQAFGVRVDYAQVIKSFSDDGVEQANRRYSPGVFLGVEKRVIAGAPDLDASHTCHVERQNLTMRMHMRRMTRLTNAFSKKARNLAAAVSLHFAFVNFVRVHETLRTTPAMAAGLSDHVWTLDELLTEAELVASDEPPSPAAPGPPVMIGGPMRTGAERPVLRVLPGGRGGAR